MSRKLDELMHAVFARVHEIRHLSPSEYRTLVADTVSAAPGDRDLPQRALLKAKGSNLDAMALLVHLRRGNPEAEVLLKTALRHHCEQHPEVRVEIAQVALLNWIIEEAEELVGLGAIEREITPGTGEVVPICTGGA
jgi:hypothetical protein